MVASAAKIVRKIESLPNSDQEVLARFLEEHLSDVLEEARWDHLLKSSPATLDELEEHVDQAIGKGEVADLDPDEL